VFVLEFLFIAPTSWLHLGQAAEPEARGQHIARDTLLCLPTVEFEVRKRVLTIPWQRREKTSKKVWKLMSCLRDMRYVAHPFP
jgi:hypothetical protein